MGEILRVNIHISAVPFRNYCASKATAVKIEDNFGRFDSCKNDGMNGGNVWVKSLLPGHPRNKSLVYTLTGRSRLSGRLHVGWQEGQQ